MLFYLFRRFKLLMVISFVVFTYISTKNYFSKTSNLYINQKAKLYASMAVEHAIRENVLQGTASEKMISITQKSYGEFAYANINTEITNQILADVLKEVNEVVKGFEHNEEITDLEIPYSYLFFRNFIFSGGPKLKLKLFPIGSVNANIVSSVDSYGINNSLVRLDLQVEMEFRVLVPLREDSITITNNIPLVVKMVNGEVPKYYYNTSKKDFIPQTPDDSPSPDV